MGFIPLRFLFTKQTGKPSIRLRELFRYGAPSAVALFSLTALISTDVVLIKHFFHPEEAGAYAAVATIGKIIFYFTAPIGSVMFPMIVQRHVKKEKYMHIFLLSVGLVLIPSLLLTLFYFVYSETIISVALHQQAYIKAAPI